MEEHRILLTAICIGSSPLPGKERVSRVEIGPFGLSGDRHATELVAVRAGRKKGTLIFNERQWSAVSEEEMERLEGALGLRLPVGALGENFRFAGAPHLSGLPCGAQLRFPSGAILMASGQNFPCQKQADYLADLLETPAVRRRFVDAALDIRGIVGWVETPGVAAEGDQVVCELP